MLILILKILLGCLFSSILTTFLGWAIHWMLHQHWSWVFHDAHMNHHQIQYPPTNFLSQDKYRDAGKDNTAYFFIGAFVPVIAGIVCLIVFHWISILVGLSMLLTMSGWGLLYNYLHDQFHIANSWCHRIPYFTKLRALHFIHHLDMNLNFGIVLFQWDKLFKTFENVTSKNK